MSYKKGTTAGLLIGVLVLWAIPALFILVWAWGEL